MEDTCDRQPTTIDQRQLVLVKKRLLAEEVCVFGVISVLICVCAVLRHSCRTGHSFSLAFLTQKEKPAGIPLLLVLLLLLVMMVSFVHPLLHPLHSVRSIRWRIRIRHMAIITMTTRAEHF